MKEQRVSFELVASAALFLPLRKASKKLYRALFIARARIMVATYGISCISTHIPITHVRMNLFHLLTSSSSSFYRSLLVFQGNIN